MKVTLRMECLQLNSPTSKNIRLICSNGNFCHSNLLTFLDSIKRDPPQPLQTGSEGNLAIHGIPKSEATFSFKNSNSEGSCDQPTKNVTTKQELGEVRKLPHLPPNSGRKTWNSISASISSSLVDCSRERKVPVPPKVRSPEPSTSLVPMLAAFCTEESSSKPKSHVEDSPMASSPLPEDNKRSRIFRSENLEEPSPKRQKVDLHSPEIVVLPYQNLLTCDEDTLRKRFEAKLRAQRSLRSQYVPQNLFNIPDTLPTACLWLSLLIVCFHLLLLPWIVLMIGVLHQYRLLLKMMITGVIGIELDAWFCPYFVYKNIFFSREVHITTCLTKRRHQDLLSWECGEL